MTGKPLNDWQLAILARMLQLQKLTNHDIAFLLECDERTIRRRRYEYRDTGALAKKKQCPKNAEKLKPEYLEKLMAWMDGNHDVLLEDCQVFLNTHFGLNVSVPTISRQLRKATGEHRPNGRNKRRKDSSQRPSMAMPSDILQQAQGSIQPEPEGQVPELLRSEAPEEAQFVPVDVGGSQAQPGGV